MPKACAKDSYLQKFEKELKHWSVDHDLERYDQLTFSDLHWKVMRLLESVPELNNDKARPKQN